MMAHIANCHRWSKDDPIRKPEDYLREPEPSAKPLDRPWERGLPVSVYEQFAHAAGVN